MTDSKEYQEAVRLITELEFSPADFATWMDGQVMKLHPSGVEKLLFLKHPCQRCGGLGVFTSVGCTSCTKLKTCPECNGTGESKVPLLVVTDSNQEPPLPDKHGCWQEIANQAYKGWVKTLKEEGN